ncbi:Zn-finger nucleic acid-binding protein [Okibacterium sp. HSC-33S16]|uniref:TFIIB-type zinc ribbon-containing protein n=1 Tax=Okibacterium sp. HSC-33S16 TaxID=2910965 RepID=UPI00209D64AD|nr:zf-TFIIB domain-containing protein [Okibacterium sp. HSC-33S16]MCP2031047.1 Zn-finger nucleic acid-binding protein [Okibacterium sp. HSC-33S16]
MKCPTDSATLVMSERSGVEIDYCPECRGVWLDRGELDKIIERAENEFTKSAPAAPAPQYSQNPRPRSPQYGERGDNDWRDNDRRYDERDGYRKSKKESWIADLFG